MIEWRPNSAPQTLALSKKYFEILYGGARGGGKTDTGIVWMTKPIQHPLYRGLVIRKNAEDLTDWLDRAGRLYGRYGAKITGRPAVIEFPSGAIIRTGHLKDDNAYTKYQGHEYQRMLIEELNQIATEKRYLQLLSSCRSTVEDIDPRIFCTTNPGGVGHGWVKQRFVDVAKPNTPYTDPVTNRKRIFIPATVDDNIDLVKKDPGYIDFLDGLKKVDEQLWKAWRLGSWDIFIGQVFGEFSTSVHVIIDPPSPEEMKTWKKIICFDWGFNAPGCALWLAIAPENKFGVQHVYCYRELYQKGKNPEQWATQMATINSVDPVNYMVLPHDCFAKPQGGRSIASIFEKIRATIISGSTMAKGMRVNRVAMTHNFLASALDAKPYLFISERCENLIRTLPTLVYDLVDVEDVDTTGEDHCYDALSTGLVSVQKHYNIALSGQVSHDRQEMQMIRLNEEGRYLPPDFLEKIRNPNRFKVPENK